MTAEVSETFLQRQLRLKQERLAAERGSLSLAEPLTEPVPSDPAWGRRAACYAASALDGAAAELASLDEGSRNSTLFAKAIKLYRWGLAGHIAVQDVTDQLRNAGLASGLPLQEVDRTLRSAWDGAQQAGADHPQPVQRDPFSGPLTDNTDYTGLFDYSDDEPGNLESVSLLETPDEARKAASDLEQIMVQAKLRELRVLDRARQLLTAEKMAAQWREPPSVPTLVEELALPREPVRYAIGNLLPLGGNALLTAAYKTGKTTLQNNLVKCYADRLPFLGRFEVTQHSGRIAVFNYELSRQQYDVWLEEAGIEHPERVAVLHLRGFRVPLTVPEVEDWVVAWLVEHEVSVWIPDPFARAATGVDENDNTAVGVWLDTLDVIKERAGVSELILPVHTGREVQEAGKERSRGATRLDDWADVRWLLTKDDEGERFFRATGRDVELPEEALVYEPSTRALTMKGGDRAWRARRRLEAAVLAYVTEHPGATVRAVRDGVEGSASATGGVLEGLRHSGHVRAEQGARDALHHYPTGKELS